MKALLLIDIQNDFLPGGTLAVPNGDEVVPVANRLMPEYRLVVATQDWHPANHLSFASQHPGKQVGETIQLDGLEQILWPDHCIQETPGAEFAPTLNRSEIDHVVPKGTDRTIDSYSGFFDNARRKATGLESLLRQHNVDAVDIMGLATDYCVKFTVLDALSLGFETRLLLEGVRGVDLQPGDSDRAIEAMRSAGATIVEPKASPPPEIVYHGKYLSMVRNGRWEYATRCSNKATVGIVAITDSGNVLLVEQHRVPVGQTVIEIPAGLAGDLVGLENEPLLDAAQRELLEETGYTANRWTRLGGGFSSPGLTDESIVIFLAEELRKETSGGGDTTEEIVTHEVPLDQVPRWLAENGFSADLKTMAGLFLVEQTLKNAPPASGS